MLATLLEQGEWACLGHDAERVLIQKHAISSIESLIEQFANLPITLKDNHRSTVKRGTLFGLDVVVKRPKDKNRRTWARLWSLVLPGEAAATIENLHKLRNAGIESVKPLLALERRVNGMVVDSWLCYQYRAGEPCDDECLDEIITLLQRMHKAGFRHDDPTSNNFLRADDGKLFTIDTKAKPCRGKFHAAIDFALLQRDRGLHNTAVHQLGNLQAASPGYQLARFYMAVKRLRSTVRDTLKKNRLRNNNS